MALEDEWTIELKFDLGILDNKWILTYSDVTFSEPILKLFLIFFFRVKF